MYASLIVANADQMQAAIEENKHMAKAWVEMLARLTGQAMGRYVTTITDARWLGRGVPMRGQPGVFAARVPRSVL